MKSPERFDKLAKQWKKEIRHVSSAKEMHNNSNYQEIIKLGSVAVPLILKDMQENGPHHWFHALRLLTGENPCAPAMAGQMQIITDAWLAWGKEKGHI